MKKKDIEAGGVYAYREGTKYGSFEPILILDTEPYRQPRQMLSQLKKTLERAPGERLTMGSYRKGTVGLLAVKPYAGAASVAALAGNLATVEGAVACNGYGEVKDEAGTVVGRYKMVTSYSYLHGPYTEVMAREAEQEEQRKKDQAVRAAQRQARHLAATALKEALEDLGFDMDHWYAGQYPVPSKVELTFVQAEALIKTAQSWVAWHGGKVSTEREAQT